VNGPPTPNRRRPTLGAVFAVAAWGAATTVIAYLISGGSIPLFVAALLALGIAQRMLAVRFARRRGGHPPRWWKL
jgi:hypothetical protein